jgi:hypothetical protein
MGEHSRMLPGFLPPACSQRDACETREIHSVQTQVCGARQADKVREA